MIFAQNKLIFYFKRNLIEVYSPKNEGVLESLSITKEVEQDEEIKDPIAYEKQIKSTLEKLNIQGKKVLVLLSPEVTFQKQFAKVDQATEDLQIQKFTGSIPFDPSQVAKKIIRDHENTSVVAANRQIYQPIITLSKSLKFEVESAVPLIVFGKAQGETLTEEDIRKIISNPGLVKQSNLLDQDKQNTKETGQQPETGEKQPEASPKAKPVTLGQRLSSASGDRKKMLTIAGLVIFILFGLVLLFIALKPLLFRAKPKTVIPSQTIQQLEEASPLSESTKAATNGANLEATQSPRLDTKKP